ncbi:MAG: YeeE/YedE family protein [Pseudomonadota bacterium]
MENPYLIILVTSSLCGLLAGFIMHRSDFCVTGMFRDLFLFRDAFMLRVLGVLIVVSMLLFELALLGGAISHHPFPLLGTPSLANIIGGFFFGVGMVLAGGCVVGTLYKMGSGSVVSIIAFVGLLAGSALYAEFHPWWGAFAKATSLTDGAVTLPQLLALPSYALTLPMALFGGVYLWRHYRRGELTRSTLLPGSIQPWQAALVLALLGFASYLFVGMPLGITTSYAKLGASVEALFAPEHVASLGYFTAMPLNYTPPLASTAITGGAGPQLDAVAAIQYPLVVGITLGAMISALLLRELRFHYRVPVSHYVSALLGGCVLGFAARMVPGCNIWHLWGGVPILAMQSLLFLLGLLPGSWLGSKLLTRYVINSK